MPIQLIRQRHGNREVIILIAEGYSITVELRVRGLELDATTVERLLHAPLAVLVQERQ